MFEAVKIVKTARDRTVHNLCPDRYAGGSPLFPPFCRTGIEMHPQVPFSDNAGVVAMLLQESGHRQSVFGDQRIIARRVDDPLLQAGSPGISPRQKAVAGRCAYGCTGMAVGKHYSLMCQSVDVRRGCLTFAGIQTAHVPVSQIVGKHIHDVRELAVP